MLAGTEKSDHFEYLVVDTGPLIKGTKLRHLARDLITTESVKSEVKDVHTRQRLDFLPVEMTTRTPSDTAMTFVKEFARQTGDIRSLSATDLSVIALTYDLEREVVGSLDHLRTSPVSCIKVNEGFGDDKETSHIAGFYMPKSARPSSRSHTTSTSSNLLQSTQGEEGDQDQIDMIDSLDKCQLDEGWTTVPTRHKTRSQTISESETIAMLQEVYDNTANLTEDIRDVEQVDDDELLDNEEFSDNDDDWITPANISEVSHRQSVPDRKCVACATTDFAMQNVLIQIGLKVVSGEGMMIRLAKTYVMKCVACFKVDHDCTRLFCAKCGNKTLEKVAVTVDEDGVTWYQRLSRKPRTGRGLRYSLPNPKGGRNANNPWITEDQPDKKHLTSSNIKSKVDVMSSDFNASSGTPFGVTNVDTRAFRVRQTGGRCKNPNESKKRTGNRKKKKI